MEKMKLFPESLRVESFVAELPRDVRGTVEAHEAMDTPGRSCLRTACCPETYAATCQC